MRMVLKSNTKGNWNERILKTINELNLKEDEIHDKKSTVKRKVTQNIKVNLKKKTSIRKVKQSQKSNILKAEHKNGNLAIENHT